MNRCANESSFKPLSWVRLSVLLLLSCFVVAVSAQDQSRLSNENIDIDTNQGFSLFEGIETSANNASRARNRVTRGNRATIANPEFSLIGTTRIGNHYSVIIQHKDGDTLVVRTTPNGNTRIPGYADYTIVDVGSGVTSIRYPQNNPCIEFRDKGVSCNSAANIAALVLTHGEPLPASNAATLAAQADSSQAANASGEGLEEVVANRGNPFEALRAAAQNGNANANANANANGASANISAAGNARFTPRRIPPEDVPPGMRVVSTPFGDRLVEQ